MFLLNLNYIMKQFLRNLKDEFIYWTTLFKNNKPKYYLSILAPVRFENDYIEEFVAYYLLHGVNHFYFYDNDPAFPLKKILKNYLTYCTIIEYPGNGIQFEVYSNWLNNFKNESEWVAVFDIDEFILPKSHDYLIDFVKEFDKKGADSIGINWMIFGNSSHKTKPKGLIINNYTFSEGKQHKNIKSITRTKKIKLLNHPHFAELFWFGKRVNAHFKKLKASSENHTDTTDIIQLNHYYTKSDEEYSVKINRNQADTGKPLISIKENLTWLFDEPSKTSKIKDTLIINKYGIQLENKITEMKNNAK
jgi:Glycosyltransferase family 92